jgi:hypothetical protein
MQTEAIIERNGFRPLGDITVGSDGRLRFPKPPDCGGLYFIAFRSGGYYVGETGQYAGTKSSVGRFGHYANPADDIWTELVINAMLLAGGGGRIHIREEPGADESRRKRMEAAVVRDFLGEGVPLWNAGGGRCEKTYLEWKIPIVERMLATASTRYAGREVLKPYAVGRLHKLPLILAAARAEAQRFGLVPQPYEPSIPRPPTPAVADERRRTSSKNPFPTIPSRIATPVLPIAPCPLAPRAHGNRKETLQAIAHRFLAAHPDATLDDLRRGLPESFNLSTIQTLWNDYRMTRIAMAPGEYVSGEHETLTIRRVACRLWDTHPGSVTKEMVEEELIRQGHARKQQTVRAIAGNTISTLEAFAALR